MPTHHDVFVVTAPGLEELAAAELAPVAASLGGTVPTATPGGVTCTGPLELIAAANLRLRTATRVLVRLGTFRARGASELQRKAAALDWGAFVGPNAPAPTIEATSHRSRLYHTGLVAQAVGRAAAATLGERTMETGPPPLVLVRLHRDECTVSVDSSGARLHQRGYRPLGARAPLRETLAAAVLTLSGWTPTETLLDPCCGSGTVLVEAALRSLRLAPGLERSFAFERWPCWPAGSLESLRAAARAEALAAPVAPLLGSDRDAAALALAATNVGRAGVEAHVQLARADLTTLARPAAPPGLVLANLPYGRRLGTRTGVERLYARFGARLRAAFGGWRVAVLVGALSPHAALGLRWERQHRLRNGGLPVLLLVGRLPADRPTQAEAPDLLSSISLDEGNMTGL